MTNENANIKQLDQKQYHEPRRPILYIILYCIGSTLCIWIGLFICMVSLVGLGLSGGDSYVISFAVLIFGGAITIIGPAIMIFFFFKTFKTSRFKKYYLIPLIAIPVILIVTFIYILFS